VSRSPVKVDVALGPRGYTITIGHGLLAQAAEVITAHHPLRQAVIVTDSNVGPLYAAALAGQVGASATHIRTLTVPAGEHSKSVRQAEELWNQLLAAGTQRDATVIALGGGVVGDLAGFVAATFARGISLVQIPTSLLAQVDSSVGGKVGINLPQAKNMVGVFWQPVHVLIDLEVLGTLPDREFRAGLAEVVKYAVILDADLFSLLERNVEAVAQRSPEVLAQIVARCCQLKAQVVERDERETSGHRAILNYGHTFAHAFETLTGYGRLLHGEAVASGMHCAAELARRMDMVDAEFVRRQQDLLKALGLDTAAPSVSSSAALEVMSRDKKALGGQLRFILPRHLGAVELVADVDPHLVRQILS
jgi:3-dehydroquinate synthase